jgi:CRISPR/Cas system-associated exonuclease Cas4 (RecB family)
MAIQPFYKSPRPTAGHHLSDLLTCPQRAWLHYYGNPQDQVKDPPYLRALQQEGIEHEKAIYEQCFPDALRIPEKGNPEERYRQTVEAMRAGVPVILQGYALVGDGIGILDILELVGTDPDSRTGHIYQVGEIKRSSTLMTAHVMQASWYTELLETVQGRRIHEACFFMKNGVRNVIDLQTLQADYEKAKAELTALREDTTAPGPHLIRACASCHWRALCMPELIANQHVSLIPGISRQQAATLEEMGINSWPDMTTASDCVLETIGMGAYEIEQVRAAIRNLEAGSPPLRQPLRPDVFQDLEVVVLEFPDLAEQRRAGMRPVPSAIHYETDAGRIGRIEVSSANDVQTADITPLLNGRRLAFYGLTDLTTFMNIARQSGFSVRNSLDIFAVTENYLHSPVPGLELEAIYSYIADRPAQRLIGPARVSAVRQVVDWMALSV